MSRLSRLPPLDSRLRLRDLRLILAIGEGGSLGRAAALINMSQPAVSKALREMEERLGVILFERGRGGTRPTAFGQILRKHAYSILADVSRAADELAEIRAGHEGLVTVGVLISATTELLPRAIERYRVGRPRASIHVEEATNDILMRALRAGEIDIVVGRLPEYRELEGIALERLYQEPASIVARAAHPVFRWREIKLKKLGELDWILPHPATTLRRRFDAIFREAGTEPPSPVVESVSLQTNHTLLAGLDLLAAVPEPIARLWAEQGQIRTLALDLPMLTGPVGIATAREHLRPPAADEFIKILRGVAAEIAPATG